MSDLRIELGDTSRPLTRTVLRFTTADGDQLHEVTLPTEDALQLRAALRPRIEEHVIQKATCECSRHALRLAAFAITHTDSEYPEYGIVAREVLEAHQEHAFQHVSDMLVEMALETPSGMVERDADGNLRLATIAVWPVAAPRNEAIDPDEPCICGRQH